MMRFIGYDSIQTRWLASIQKNRDDKWHRVIVALHDAICRLRFYSNSLIHILSLSNSHNNVASIQKNRGDKSHHVNVALDSSSHSHKSRLMTQRPSRENRNLDVFMAKTEILIRSLSTIILTLTEYFTPFRLKTFDSSSSSPWQLPFWNWSTLCAIVCKET